ncbi:peptidoglycan DD-metalloendopeptidase family protein [Winogradskyella echinorum]|uniref:Peptidoglycan DD-metalloendopeptidase family protein n=1 Tax=Winogradskyella echinorum TaxID=538189 RepID=A0ABR6XYW0_9FLAO|nr:peptidoglycan DD-metalloendopeptidase family protein [Winogradskyella echinorum]MBC3845683.1 peptidoglycan DD-metalloendopeptidase family protein [Winogradskyella echinorum]MBC5750031.1 peptidoglycan DD-metalloendopeptidase family protein [Winogradskyella echinorum]
MKLKTTLVILILLSSYFCSAQNPNITPKGGEFVFNPERSECITAEQRQEIEKTINANITMLKKQKKLIYSEQKGGSHPLFAWPLQKSSTSTYNEIYGISGYIDHNTSFPNQLTDYNCGSRSYDTDSGYNHQGIDMFTWPFGWKMLDNDEVEIIAAAPGQIVAKNDGEYDRSCNFNSNTWNAIYVQHSDGSISFYGHMKNGSLSTKNIGDTVVEGEYLGVVGSSGNSTGPHLHFETFTDNSFTQLVDPYSGTCNSMNTDTWWQSQKPYNNPGINAVLTHSAAPVFPDCPTTEITNESNQFDVNETVTHYIYLRDQVAGTSVNLRIIKPDNTDLFNWNFNLTDNYYASYWGGWTSIPDVAGEWKWEATYNGETVTHSYNVGTLSVEDENLESASIYPNPFNDVVNINSTTKIKAAKIVDVLGKTVKTFNETTDEGIRELNLTELSNGLYFITLVGEQNQKKTIKMIKK